MKYISPATMTSLQSPTNTFVQCVRIQTQAGTVFGFTEHDQPIVVAGESYYPGVLSGSTTEQGHMLAVGNMQVSGPYSETVTKLSVRRGLFENAVIRVFSVDWASPGDGTIELIVGRVADVTDGEFGFLFQFDDLRQSLDRVITRSLNPQCDANFCDSRCKLSVGAYTVTGTLTGVTDQRTLVAAGLASADEYFTGGILTMTSGAATGWSRDVKDFMSKTFALHFMLPFDVAVGDHFSAVAGCDKSMIACQKFGNLLNFRGFVYTPGINFLLTSGIKP